MQIQSLVRMLYLRGVIVLKIYLLTFSNTMTYMYLLSPTSVSQLVEYVQAQRKGGLVWGCRHDVPGAAHDCFYFVNRKAFLLCDRYEPISEEVRFILFSMG